MAGLGTVAEVAVAATGGENISKWGVDQAAWMFYRGGWVTDVTCWFLGNR